MTGRGIERRRSFRSFFKTATDLRAGPHEYQANLAECELLPDILSVPTGCGKTAAAVLSWAWRRRECPDEDIRRRTPRRLVYCLPMRSLVEQVHDNVVKWFANLGWIQHTQPLNASYRPDWSGDEVPVFRLMGGEEAAEWEGQPEREAVLVGTQDMLLSRALNRGYAMNPYRWPIAFGLVNVDALWILDEVQLMGTGRTTSVQLHQFRPSPEHLPRESLWMSATIGTTNPRHAGQPWWTQPAPKWMQTPEHGDRDVTVLGLGAADRKTMSRVLTGPKRVVRSTIPDRGHLSGSSRTTPASRRRRAIRSGHDQPRRARPGAARASLGASRFQPRCPRDAASALSFSTP